MKLMIWVILCKQMRQCILMISSENWTSIPPSGHVDCRPRNPGRPQASEFGLGAAEAGDQFPGLFVIESPSTLGGNLKYGVHATHCPWKEAIFCSGRGLMRSIGFAATIVP